MEMVVILCRQSCQVVQKDNCQIGAVVISEAAAF